jgi:regulator of PEP synthase PpsR (kinase-PPPase family)
MIQPERLAMLRETRVDRLGTRGTGYADLEFVRREITYAYELLGRRPDWPIIDMTAKSIEEAAAEVINLVGRRANG